MADNYIAFKKALAEGKSVEDAAMSTFTGKMAKRYGFTRVILDPKAGPQNFEGHATSLFLPP